MTKQGAILGASALFGLGGAFLATAAASDRLPIERVSVSESGIQGNKGGALAFGRSVTDDGQQVVFTSGSDNLIAGDYNDGFDFSYAILRHRNNNTNAWLAAPVVRYFAVSNPQITTDGRYAVFATSQHLVPGDSDLLDIYRKDLQTGTVARVNQPAGGGNWPEYCEPYADMSSDGRFITFMCGGTPSEPALPKKSYIRDMDSSAIEGVCLNDADTEIGLCGGNAISDNGRFIAFMSSAAGFGLPPGSLTNIFIRDRVAGSTTRVTRGFNGAEPIGNSYSSFMELSGDGRFLLFHSEATNLVPDDTNGRTDVFLYDRDLGSIERVSLTLAGQQSPSHATIGGMSSDGTKIAYRYTSAANQEIVVYYDRTLGVRVPLNFTFDGTFIANAGAQGMSANGRYVTVRAPDALTTDPTDGNDDAFVIDAKQAIQTFVDGFEEALP